MEKDPFTDFALSQLMLPSSDPLAGLAQTVKLVLTQLRAIRPAPAHNAELYCLTISELAAQSGSLPPKQRNAMLSGLPRRIAHAVSLELQPPQDSVDNLHRMQINEVLSTLATSGERDSLIRELPKHLRGCCELLLREERESTMEQMMRERLEETDDDDKSNLHSETFTCDSEFAIEQLGKEDFTAEFGPSMQSSGACTA